MTELAELQLLVLDLISPRPDIDPARISSLNAADWERILAMVRQHRLGPLLHWQLARGRAGLPVPVGVREELAKDIKRATLHAQVMRREWVLIHRLLTVAGIPCLALKGAFLAYYAYPKPGLRPMRDLDILVPAAEALRAFEVLIGGGLIRPPQYQGDVQAQMCIFRHLPPLRTASGLAMVEVHASLHNTDEGKPCRHDPCSAPTFWRRAIEVQVGGETLRVPAPTDQLLHLIAHAILDHKFSNGPLILSDIAFLLERQPIDWASFWRTASEGRLKRACWLTLRLVEAYWGGENIGWPAESMTFPSTDRALQQGALLMLRDCDASSDVHLAHELGQVDSARAWLWFLVDRLFPPKAQIAIAYPVRQDSALLYLYYLLRLWRLASQRLPQFIKSRRQLHVRAELELLDDMENWLGGC